MYSITHTLYIDLKLKLNHYLINDWLIIIISYYLKSLNLSQLSKIYNNYINVRKLNAIKSGNKSFHGFLIIDVLQKNVFIHLSIQPITLLHMILINVKLFYSTSIQFISLTMGIHQSSLFGLLQYLIQFV